MRIFRDQAMTAETLHRLKIVYAFALAFIALTIISSSGIMEYAIQRNGGDSRVINLSGRQRMLSQRLTKCVLALDRAASTTERASRIKELTESFGAWKAAHRGLQYGDDALGLPRRTNSAEIVRLFSQIEPHHVAMVAALDGLLARVHDEIPDSAAVRTAAEVMLTYEPLFLTLMDKITFQFDKEAKERISSMQRLEVVILAIGLLVLSLEFLLVFRPSLNQLTVMMTSLKNTTDSLQESNHRIMDSIHYAEMIQGAVLPASAEFERLFSYALPIYRPRDVVGGDLLFLRALDDGFLVAVIDCTGHGVPGALMTMSVHAVLGNVIAREESSDPAVMLGHLNREIRAILHHGGSPGVNRIDNGLDIGLCRYSEARQQLSFAGARIDLSIVHPGAAETEIIKGDRKALGYNRTNPDYQFTRHDVEVRPGTLFCMTTDGLLDQPGGDKGLPFGNRLFAGLLRELSTLPPAAREARFNESLAEWQGDVPQRDDIALLAFTPNLPPSEVIL